MAQFRDQCEWKFAGDIQEGLLLEHRSDTTCGPSEEGGREQGASSLKVKELKNRRGWALEVSSKLPQESGCWCLGLCEILFVQVSVGLHQRQTLVYLQTTMICLVVFNKDKGILIPVVCFCSLPLLSHPAHGAPNLCQDWTPFCPDFRHSSGDLSPQGATATQWVRLCSSLTQWLWEWYFHLFLSSLPSSSGAPGVMSLKNVGFYVRQEEPLMSDSSAFSVQNPWCRSALTF